MDSLADDRKPWAAVPVKPWIVDVGKRARHHGVYVYASDGHHTVTLGISNGSIDGVPFRPHTLDLHREHLEAGLVDLVEFACRELHAQYLFARAPVRSHSRGEPVLGSRKLRSLPSDRPAPIDE